MGTLFGGGSQPKVPKLPPAPPPAIPPTLANPLTNQSGNMARQRAAAAAGAGFSGTLATTGKGLTEPVSTAPVSLLGG